MTEEDLPTLDDLRDAIRKVLDTSEISQLADTELLTATVAAWDKVQNNEEEYTDAVVLTINCGHNLWKMGSLEGEEL